MTTETMTTLRRDRFTIGMALSLVTLLSWAYMLKLAGGMAHHGHETMALMTLPAPPGWDWHTLGLTVSMWCVMMIAMMLPSTAPMVSTFTRVYEQRRQLPGGIVVPTSIFVAGYLAMWSVFGVVAAVLQLALHEAALVASPMDKLGPQASAVLLIAAGALQFSAFKVACLEKCRTPLSFLLAEWREGRVGAFVMGIRHGAFCVGCCWALMLLMFVGGTMNLLWMAGLTVLVLLEKVLRNGYGFSRIAGVVMILTGIWLLAGSLT